MKKAHEVGRGVTPEGQLREGAMAPIMGYLLAQASVTTNQVFVAVAQSEFKLRKVEFTILALLSANPDVTGSALAKALSFTSPNITMWLDKLETRGLIERERSVNDRRSQHVRVSSKGAALIHEVSRRVAEAEQLALASLSYGERVMLAELLHKVANCRQKSTRAPRDGDPVSPTRGKPSKRAHDSEAS